MVCFFLLFLCQPTSISYWRLMHCDAQQVATIGCSFRRAKVHPTITPPSVQRVSVQRVFVQRVYVPCLVLQVPVNVNIHPTTPPVQCACVPLYVCHCMCATVCVPLYVCHPRFAVNVGIPPCPTSLSNVDAWQCMCAILEGELEAFCTC